LFRTIFLKSLTQLALDQHFKLLNHKVLSLTEYFYHDNTSC